MFRELVDADPAAEAHVRIVQADEPVTPTAPIVLIDATPPEAIYY
jgi:hypothetical protein